MGAVVPVFALTTIALWGLSLAPFGAVLAAGAVFFMFRKNRRPWPDAPG